MSHRTSVSPANTLAGAISGALAGAVAAGLSAWAPLAAWAIELEFEVVDTTGSTAVSLALDAVGEPHFLYEDGAHEAARYARKAAGAWSYDALNFAFFGEGGHPSLQIDAQGDPRAVYQATNLQFPIYARKGGGVWAFEAPAPGEQSGLFNSLQLDAQGFPHFTDFIGGLTYMIRYHWRTAAGWTTQIVEAVNDIGVSGTALALDADDGPHVTYNGPGLSLRYAFRQGGVWTRETIEPSGCNTSAPIGFDAEGTPCIAYSTADGIRYARRVAGVWTSEAVLPSGPFGLATLSLAHDSVGEPHLLFSPGFTGDLHYVRRQGGVWTEETFVDWDNNVGYANALVLDANDNPHIAFVDATAGSIYYGHVPAVADAHGEGGSAGSALARPRLLISPNPSSGRDVVVRLVGGARSLDGEATRFGAAALDAAVLDAAVFDAAGRFVRRLTAGARGGSSSAPAWSMDERSAPLAPGIYFVRVASGPNRLTGRLSVIR